MRLQRVGRKHEPTFRLVLTDSKNSTKSGRFQEVLGAYDPRRAIDTFNTERIMALVAQGVSLTGSVNNLLLKHGIIRGKKVHVGAHFVAKAPEATPEPVVEEAALAEESSATESSPEPVAEEAAPVEEAPAPEAASEPVVETAAEAPVEAPVAEEAPAEAPAPEASPQTTDTQNS